MALGAMPQQVFLTIIADGMRPVLLGLIFGFATAHGRWPIDPIPTFRNRPNRSEHILGTAGILLAVSLSACLIPASNAIRLDPMAILRSQ
jgi:ABC-type lipoprotein release transport system permease subunit